MSECDGTLYIAMSVSTSHGRPLGLMGFAWHVVEAVMMLAAYPALLVSQRHLLNPCDP
jgi:hypothetical protein